MNQNQLSICKKLTQLPFTENDLFNNKVAVKYQNSTLGTCVFCT